MAEDKIDHLAMAGDAARLSDLAVRRSEEGRRDEALTAAEEAVTLYRALAEDFPTMFGADAEHAGALATAIREGRPLAPAAVSTAARPRERADESVPAGRPAPGTAPVPDGPGSDVTSGPEPAVPPARTAGGPGRSRRRTVVSVVAVSAAVVVVLGGIGAAGWALSRPHPPAAAPAPPAAAPARPWTGTARTDVAPTGVTLRSAPSTAGTSVGRLLTGVEVQIQCAEVGRMTSTDGGERSSAWLRTSAGAYLAAINADVRGPSPMKNCKPGGPPVPLPHHG